MGSHKEAQDQNLEEKSYVNICKVVHVITGLGDGGAEAALYRMISSKNFSEENIVVSLLGKSKYGKLLEENGIKVFCMEMAFNTKLLNKFFELYVLLKKIKPDVIQTWMYHADLIGGMVGRFSGCNNIVWGVYCTNFNFRDTKFSTIFIIFINSFLSRFVPKKIIFCSKDGLNIHRKYGYSKNKLIYIPNGLPHETFTINTESNVELKRQFNFDESCIILGIVGRYSPMKDHLNFIMALERLSLVIQNFHVLFIGENLDYHNKTLVSQLKKYNVERNVKLLGARNDIPKLMNLMDLNVLSSSFGEGQPTVLCESMLSGTPCITTDTGDSALIVGDYGWVVTPNNPQELCNHILKAIKARQDEVDWNKRVLKGREYIISKFSIETMSESYKSVWRQ